MRRPLLTREARAELRRAANNARSFAERDNPNRAYARGVLDVLHWLDGGDETPMLKEVTR